MLFSVFCFWHRWHIYVVFLGLEDFAFYLGQVSYNCTPISDLLDSASVNIFNHLYIVIWKWNSTSIYISTFCFQGHRIFHMCTVYSMSYLFQLDGFIIDTRNGITICWWVWFWLAVFNAFCTFPSLYTPMSFECAISATVLF